VLEGADASKQVLESSEGLTSKAEGIFDDPNPGGPFETLHEVLGREEDEPEDVDRN
jgi:hypothetical protein